jgi:hypothetical protein
VIELERHIEILLLNNDCVIIPNFGGFMAHYCEAHYDIRDNSFLPPTRSIGFNPQLRINDSLLAQSYVEAYDISYPEALRRIEKETDELRQILENQGYYEFNDIGILRTSNEGHYSFEPCEAGLLTPALYGLSSYQMPLLASQEEDEPKIEIKTINQKAPAIIDLYSEDKEEKEEKTYTIRRSVVRNLAVACIALLAFLLIPSSLGNGEVATISGNKIDTELLTRIMPKDVTIGNVKHDISKAMTDKAISAVNNEKNKADSEKNIDKKESSYYCIVLASRVAKRNAAEYVEKLHNKGYDKAVVLSKNNKTKVVYGEYTSENEARLALNKLNDKADFADCWVLHIK